MDPGNVREALRELRLDEEEGADWVMVKPGLPYLDVVKTVRDNTSLPVAVYHVSGEYSMLRAAAANGWLDYEQYVKLNLQMFSTCCDSHLYVCIIRCLLESLTSMRRAGASIIFTYGALDAARLLQAGFSS